METRSAHLSSTSTSTVAQGLQAARAPHKQVALAAHVKVGNIQVAAQELGQTPASVAAGALAPLVWPTVDKAAAEMARQATGPEAREEAAAPALPGVLAEMEGTVI